MCIFDLFRNSTQKSCTDNIMLYHLINNLALKTVLTYFLKSFFSFLGLFIVLLYLVSWGDDQMQMIYQEIGFKSFSSSLQLIWESVKYLVDLIFYGWWLWLVLGSVLLSVISTTIKYGIQKLSPNSKQSVV